MDYIVCQAPLSMRFPWSELPFPSPGDLSDPGIKLASPALQVDSLPLSHQGTDIGKYFLYVNLYINIQHLYYFHYF